MFTDAGDDAGNAADQGDIGLGGVEDRIGTRAVVDQGAKMQGGGGEADVAVIDTRLDMGEEGGGS